MSKAFLALTETRQLAKEISLKRSFVAPQEVTLLSIVWTWKKLELISRQFFADHDISDVQFNALMILLDGEPQLPSQTELAELLVINRASAGTLIDRLEAVDWVKRMPVEGDRRAYNIALTAAGRKKVLAVRGPYYEQVNALLVGLTIADQQALVALLGKLRNTQR
jgi:DNA-binding MarR family transcriptional regulator